VFGAAAVEASYDVPGAAGAGNGCDVPCAAGVGFGDVPGRDGAVMGDHIAPSRAGAGCRSSLEIWHPVVLAVYFAGTVAIAMFGMHPGCVGISLVGGLALCSLLAGVRSSLAKLRWQLPLLLLVCVVNPLYSALGSTLLARVGPFRIYAESLAYGGMMGALFVSVLLWFEAASLVLGSDELLELAGAHLPHVALALSMVLRLIPLMLRRIRQAHDALGATRGQRGGVREATRLLGALLTWSLEDSV
jgi:energy-coupling factor transport system permease protein